MEDELSKLSQERPERVCPSCGSKNCEPRRWGGMCMDCGQLFRDEEPKLGRLPEKEAKMRAAARSLRGEFVMEFRLGEELYRVTIEGWADERMPVEAEPCWVPLPGIAEDELDRVLVRALRWLPVALGERRRAAAAGTAQAAGEFLETMEEAPRRSSSYEGLRLRAQKGGGE